MQQFALLANTLWLVLRGMAACWLDGPRVLPWLFYGIPCLVLCFIVNQSPGVDPGVVVVHEGSGPLLEDPQTVEIDHLQKRALKLCLHITGDVPENILLTSADVAHLGRRREAHILNYMYKNKEKEELLDIKNVNTRCRVAPLFKTVIPSCEKYKNSAFTMVLFYGICYL